MRPPIKKLRVAVLAGGWSRERLISIESGKAVFAALKSLKWPASFFDLKAEPGLKAARRSRSPQGAIAVRPSQLLGRLKARGVDVVFNTLHGPFGEDGRVQALLEMGGIRSTGSNSRASALAMDKFQCKAYLQAMGIPVPAGQLVLEGQKAPRVSLPCFVKPCDDGSSFGVTLAKTPAQFKRGLKTAWVGGGRALVEARVKGREFTVSVLGNRALSVIEIVPGNEFYDYESKYGKAGYQHLVPAPISIAVAKRMKMIGLKTHKALGCRGYSRVDMMMTSSGDVRVIEVNTNPGMTGKSLLPDAAAADNISFEDLVLEMIQHSLEGQ